jgi:arginine decarboxylase
VRGGRNPINNPRFNESFMMHSSTSPLYPIIASNEITATMMDSSGGVTLTTESTEEAVAFRQTIGRIGRHFRARGEWFFQTWNADDLTDPETGRRVHSER